MCAGAAKKKPPGSDFAEPGVHSNARSLVNGACADPGGMLGLDQSYRAELSGSFAFSSDRVVSMRKFDCVRWRSAKKNLSG